MSHPPVTPNRLRELFDYDPSTGLLTVKTWRRGSGPVGSQVGHVERGYVRCVVDGRGMKRSRIAWAMHYGQHPGDSIDHINGNRADDRIANLRDVSNQVNQQNRRAACSVSTTGLLGVARGRTGGFAAEIVFNGRTVRAATFGSAEAAHEFYLQLKRRLHDGCTL